MNSFLLFATVCKIFVNTFWVLSFPHFTLKLIVFSSVYVYKNLKKEQKILSSEAGDGASVFSFFFSVFFLALDIRGHAGVATSGCVGSSLQRWILRRRVGTDRGPTGHVLADKGTVLGELATFINTNKNSSVRTGSGGTDGRFVAALLLWFRRFFLLFSGQQTHIAH